MKALVTNVDGLAMEKRRLDQRLDKALEESFPGSDPVSISQPAPDNTPRGLGRATMVNGATGALEDPMKVPVRNAALMLNSWTSMISLPISPFVRCSANT